MLLRSKRQYINPGRMGLQTLSRGVCQAGGTVEQGNPCATAVLFLVIFLTLPTAGDLSEQTKGHKKIPRYTCMGPSQQGRLQASSC